MGRLITFDNFVQVTLNAITKNKTNHTGLIIGQCTDQKDIVLHLCPTPKKDEIADSGNDSAQKQPKTKSKEDIDLDENWICQHAKQLMRTLPGGLDILGLYVAASSDFNIKQQAQLRQVLFSIYKTLGKNQNVHFASNERILLNICPTTSKIICKTYDISDFKCSANPADWKLQSGNMRWQRLRCQLAVDVKFPIKSESGNLSLRKQIDLGLHSFLESVKEAHALVNGQQRELDEPLDIFAEGKRSKKKQTEKDDKQTSQWHNIELFIPLENNNISEPHVFESACMMTFKGAVQCRAYVHGKSTVKEAINALKQDIIRSIVARCEIHCEDLLLIEEEQQDPLVVHELPRRVFAPLPQGDISVCDYQFHSDTARDSLEAFKELLNLDLTEEDIDTSCEISPTTSTLILPEAVEDRLSEFGDAPAPSPLNIYIPIAGVVAAIALGVASVYITSQST